MGKSAEKYFKGKKVWITGASSGIGAALAIACSRLGSRVILSGRDTGRLEKVASMCSQHTTPQTVVFDQEKTKLIPAICQDVIDLSGPIDILVLNAGVSQRSLALETSIRVDKKIMDTNFLGSVTITKSLMPSMLGNNSGHIVVISSATGKFGTPYRSAYSASKHALHGYFDTLRAELNNKIPVTIICPGFVQSQISVNALTGNGEKLGSMDPLTERGMMPETFARKALLAISLQKEEVYIGKWKEWSAIQIKRFLPSLFSKIIRNAKVR